MELNYENFQTIRPRLLDGLSSSDFFSVDFEFTGLDRDHTTELPHITKDSTAAEQQQCADQIIAELTTLPTTTYAHKAATISQYSLMQVGVSIFIPTRNSNDEKKGPPDDYVSRGLFYMARHYGEEGLAPLEPLCSRGNDTTSAHAVGLSLQEQVEAAKVLKSVKWVLDSAKVKETFSTLWLEEVPRLHSTAKERMETLVPALPSSTAERDSQLSDAACVERLAQLQKGLDVYQELLRTMDTVRLLAGWLNKTCTLGAAPTAAPAKGEEEHSMWSNESYHVQTYSAFLFPSHHSSTFADILLNSETVGQFLTENSELDFNKWIRGGLRFMAADEYLRSADLEQSVGEAIKELESVVSAKDTAGKSGASGKPTNTTSRLFGCGLKPLEPLTEKEKEYVTFLETATADEALLKSLATEALMLFRLLRDPDEDETPKNSCQYVKDPLFSDYRRALQRLGFEKNNEKRCLMKVQQKTAKPVKGAYGSELLLHLVNASRRLRKPIIFHNGYTDLMFFVKTVCGFLPPTLEGFKHIVRTLFPHLYDTRALAFAPVLQGFGNLRGTLANSHKALSGTYGSRVTLIRDDTTGNKDEAAAMADNLHDAGYDAYLTGCLFLYERQALATPGASSNAQLSQWELIVPLFGSILCLNMRQGAKEVLPQHPLLPVVVVLVDLYTFPTELRRFCKQQRMEVPLSILPRKGVGYICLLGPTSTTDTDASLGQQAETGMQAIEDFCLSLTSKARTSHAFIVPYDTRTLLQQNAIDCIH